MPAWTTPNSSDDDPESSYEGADSWDDPHWSCEGDDLKSSESSSDGGGPESSESSDEGNDAALVAAADAVSGWCPCHFLEFIYSFLSYSRRWYQ